MKQPRILKGILSKNQILFMESVVNYTMIHLANGKTLVSGHHLKLYEQTTDSEKFIRVGRSYLINKSYIQNVTASQKAVSVVLTNGESIPVSRRRMKAVKMAYDFV